ncbi:MAG TPA: DUF262 domain-containing protein [Phycisphaerae bacterium]|nr:DUF262 domain-containing protein [Phycisphaerae bacterium]HRR86165.1 DUF262 domain-containing protein [Phycisphaerae bacterium]
MSTDGYDITPDKRPIIGLVQQAYEGKACLPNFQRDFVWPREGVADLLRSVLRGYYIGALLLLRSDPQEPPFAPVFLRGAKPAHRDPRPELLILDGQQRLTALLYALTAPQLPLKDSSRPRRFFTDLQLLLEEPDNDGIVFDVAENELNGLEHEEEQYRRRILPCTTMFRLDDFMTWRDGLDDWLREQEPENHKRFREEWRTPWTKAVGAFQNFLVPLVELPQVRDSDTFAIGRVCAIFEKLNSTGVDLSVYDLLTARLYRHRIRLHQLWKETCQQHKRIAAWSGGKADTNKLGVLVLRTLALLRGLEPKPRILINLKPEGFEDDWRRAAAAMERAFELVEHVGPDGFGVFHQKWLPGFGLIPVLAALRAEIEERNLGEAARAELRRWYWCNVFLERFSSGVESKSRKDYAEFLDHWLNDKPEPAVFAEARARIGAAGYSIRGSASYASAVYCGVFCLLAIRGARDWSLGESIQLQKLNDHHVFPRAYLREHKITKKPVVNSIVNRTLISNMTNNKIKAKRPSEYLAMPEIVPPLRGDAVLEPHFLDEASRAALRATVPSLSSEEVAAQYEAFCTARERTIIAEIRRVCGIDMDVEAPGGR